MEVKKICTLGAGTMGSQIAQLVAMSGYEVSMFDIEDKFVQGGLNAIKKTLQRFFVEKEKMTQEAADALLGKIKGTTDLKEAVKDVQVVIESIPENLELKQRTFKELDELCPPETILASNTSSFKVTAIGSLVKRQDKVIGMHFFNPVARMTLLEIIRTDKTSDETFEIIKDLAVKMGRQPITVKDSPAFVANRILHVMHLEAAKMLEDGIASVEDIDKACTLGLGHGVGPFTAVDMTNSMGIAVELGDYLAVELGERYRVSPMVRKKAEAGELGRAAGKGYYDYTQQQ
ncbi:3-hydroxybutyryl-CoA dehydrogenase [subsurface metagenome]